MIIFRPETFLKKEIDQSEPAVNGNAMKDRHQTFCSDSDTDHEDDLFVNPNHFQSLVIHSDSDSSDEEVSDDDISAEEDSDVDSPSNDTEIKAIMDNNNTN